MKKEYITPEISIYLLAKPELLAGSMLAGDQGNPTMAPEFDLESLLPDDGLATPGNEFMNFAE